MYNWLEYKGERFDNIMLGWSQRYHYVIGREFPDNWTVSHYSKLPSPPKSLFNREENFDSPASLIESTGYVLIKSEWDIYHNFRPSLLQKIIWFFWPSLLHINYKRYRNVKRDDCFDG